MPTEGLPALLARLDAMQLAITAAGQRIVARSQIAFEAAVKRQFTLAHTAGTPSPAQPGEAPAVVSGTLRRGFTRTTPAVGALGQWTGRVYPTTVYARIHELGGVTGRNNATTLPPRPYMEPARKQVEPALNRINVEEFGAAIGR
jgi:phage gpG-like protein